VGPTHKAEAKKLHIAHAEPLIARFRANSVRSVHSTPNTTAAVPNADEQPVSTGRDAVSDHCRREQRIQNDQG
jgi:hypothetical protein